MVETAVTMGSPPAPPRPKSNSADVFIGFMDEEVAGVLRRLREQCPRRPIVVIERKTGLTKDKHDGEYHRLFERDLDYYKIERDGDRIHLDTLFSDESHDEPTTVAQRVAQGLHATFTPELGGELARLKAAGAAKTAVKGTLQPVLAVTRFESDTQDEDAPPIFLVRSPEMGKQPDLTVAYLRPLLATIKQQYSGMRVHCFGAGGAVGEGKKPGSQSFVVGSVYVGVRRIDGGPHNPTYEARIELMGLSGKPVVFYAGQRFSVGVHKDGTSPDDKHARAKAEQEAQTAFHKNAGRLRPLNVHYEDGQRTVEVEKNGPSLSQAVKHLIVDYKERHPETDPSVSLTLSYFGGEKDKHAGRKLIRHGLSDVAMEDSHVLQVIAELGLDENMVKILRVECDPSRISTPLKKRMTEWAHRARLSVEEYEDLLRWGIEKNAATNLAPDAARWEIFKADSGPQKNDLFSKFLGVFGLGRPASDLDYVAATDRGPGREKIILNGFYMEIATDLAAEAENGEALSAFKQHADKAFKDQLKKGASAEVQAQFESLWEGKIAEVKALAEKAKAAPGSKSDAKNPVRQFIQSLTSIDLSDGRYGELRQFLERTPEARAALNVAEDAHGNLRIRLLEDSPEALKVYIRPGKSKGPADAATLDALGDLHPDDLDRSLYKASGQELLRVSEPVYVDQELKLIARAKKLQGRKAPAGDDLTLVDQRLRPKLLVARAAREKVRASGAGAPSLDAALVTGGAGKPLPENVRATLEPALGTSFADVRVHVDSRASMAAAAINAEAFTVGRHIYFNRGYYDPGSARGIALIGHELTHVAQESGSVQRSALSSGVTAQAPAPKAGRGSWWNRLYGRDVLLARRKALEVAGHDDLERQAIGNERAILDHLRSGGQGGLGPLPVTPGAALRARGRLIRRSEGGVVSAASGELTNAQLAQLSDTEFWNVVKDWDADTFARHIYDDAKGVMVDAELNAKFRGILTATRDRMMNTLDEATRMSLARGEFNLKDTPGIVKKLREGKKVGEVGDMIRARVDLQKYNAEELKEMVERLGQRYPKSNFQKFNLMIDNANLEQSLAHYRGRFNFKEIRDVETNMKFELQVGSEWITKFYESIEVMMPGGGKLNIHDAMYKGADKIKEIVEANKGALSAEELAAFDASYAKLEKAYVESLQQVVDLFVQGKAADAEVVRDLVTKTGYLAESERFFQEPQVHWIIKELGSVAPPAGLEGKVLKQLATDKAYLHMQKPAPPPEHGGGGGGGGEGGGGGATAEEPGFIRSMINRALSWVEDIFGRCTTAMSELGEELLGKFAEGRPWLKDLLWGEEFGIFSVMLPEVKSVFTALKTSLSEAASIVGSILKRIGKMFEPIIRVLGPVLSGFGLLSDFLDMRKGPPHLAEDTGDALAKEHLVQQDEPGQHIHGLYWYPGMFADTLDFLSTFLGPLKLAGLAASVFRQGWGGVFKKRWGIGFPLGIAIWRGKDKPAPESKRGGWHFFGRKRRGSSQYADDDPEIAHQFQAAIDRYGEEPGVSLDWFTKSRLERFLGHDLGDARIHTGPLAREVTRATEAEAITFGRDIYIPSERLGSLEGPALLAHEATHVAQALPSTPTASPRSLGAGAGIEAMEDVARSIEARFRVSARAPAYPVLAEPIVRSAPIAPAAVPSADPGPGPAIEAPASAPVAQAAPHRRAVEGSAPSDQSPGFDPVREVMRQFKVSKAVSQEEFLEICTERLMSLVKEELASDADRRESLAWSHDLPSC